MVLSSIFFLNDRRCCLCGDVRSKAGICEQCLKKLPLIGDGNRCLWCGLPLTSENNICMRCRSVEEHSISNFPLAIYEGVIKELIHLYKFQNQTEIAITFAKLAAETYFMKFSGRIVVPAPPRRGKIKRTGWDQIELIVRIMEKRYGIPVSRILKRKDNKEQKKLDFDQRQSNLQESLYAGRAIDFDKYLLFDDVFTTGTTLKCCAKVLKQEGVDDIQGMTLAIV